MDQRVFPDDHEPDRGLGILGVEERDRNCTLVLIRCFDLGSVLLVGTVRMGRRVSVRAKPVPMLGGHMLVCVTFLVNVQQWGLLQSEQQYRA